MLNKAKLKGYAIIFDPDGMPIIDNPSTVPTDAWKTLTKEQQLHANSRVELQLRNKDYNHV